MLVKGPLGFSLPSAVSSVAKSAYNVASDPRAQAAAAVVGQEFAPEKTAQIQQQARNVSRTISRVRMALDPNSGRMVPMGPMPDPGYDQGGGSMPVQSSNMLVYAGIGFGALVLFLLLRK